MSAERQAAFEPGFKDEVATRPPRNRACFSGQCVLPKEFLRLTPPLKQRRVIRPKNAIDNLYQLNRLKPPTR